MITAIFTLSQVRGAELWLLFWCISLVAYIGIGYKLKVNQTKQDISTSQILNSHLIIHLTAVIVQFS